MRAISPWRILLLATLFISCTETAFAQKRLRRKIDSLMAQHPQFSGVVLVADYGKQRYYKAFGYRNFPDKIKLKRDDLFELASISKTFTSMAILLLEKEGKLSVDDSVSRYLSVPYPGITIRHLLNHTSGLPDYQAVMDQHWDKSKVAGNDDIIAYLNRYAPPVLFAPGARYEYSNTGYVLLGSIVEKASGMDFTAFCREKIFRPLQMGNTDIRSNTQKAAIPEFALGHVWVESSQRFERADAFPSSDYTIWLGNRKGPGRVSSTARDLLRWDQALYDKQLLQQSDLRKAFQPAKLNDGSLSNYGFGWMLTAVPVLGITVWHSGDNPGYHTRLMRYTGKRMTLIVLNNNAYPKFDALIDTMESILAGN
jgi:CubicO group peptidase (beta-lactamase class C family)